MLISSSGIVDERSASSGVKSAVRARLSGGESEASKDRYVGEKEQLKKIQLHMHFSS